MSQKIVLFGGTNRDENKAADTALSSLESVDIEFVPTGKILEPHVHLPFIETASGRRYYGLPSIERFVKEERERTQ